MSLMIFPPAGIYDISSFFIEPVINSITIYTNIAPIILKIAAKVFPREGRRESYKR